MNHVACLALLGSNSNIHTTYLTRMASLLSRFSAASETLPQLDGLEKSFHSFYVCTAVRKFFFFLDPLRTGRIRIQDVLSCSFLDDLLELRDQELPKELQEANWFSGPSALRVYGQYLNLDTDHNLTTTTTSNT